MARPATATVEIVVELGKRRCFASALDWPGWCRSGPDEERAVESLLAYAPRYRSVLEATGVPAPEGTRVEVIERLAGSATTDFGAPGAIAAAEAQPVGSAEARRLCACVEAAWAGLNAAAAVAPPELRKGPRGGGRDRDAVVRHVAEAESAYARKVGLRFPPGTADDPGALTAARAELLAQLCRDAGHLDPDLPARSWPARYALRRIGWHALDHAWEIEDRSTMPG